MIRIFIGYDPSEAVAYNVLSHSLMEHSSSPISITPVNLQNLAYIFDRPRTKLESTEFSISRFLVPYLCEYEGWAIFMDCDFLCMDDVMKLWSLRDGKHSLMCVKHLHNPREVIKFAGNIQTKYQRKNWSSLMMFNNKRCRALTRDYVQTAPGLDLHQFKWCSGTIGDIDKRWNHLVGYCPHTRDVSMVHYTTGGPYFDEFAGCQYAGDWFAARERAVHAAQAEVSTERTTAYASSTRDVRSV